MKNYKTYFFILIAVTFISSTAYTQNMAFVFNGESSYLSNDVNPGLYITASDKISVEAWVYLVGDHAGNKIPILSGVEGSLEIFSLSIQDGEASFKVNGTQISTNNDGVPIFEWVHLAGTFDGDLTKIYINGKEVDETILQDIGSGPSAYVDGLYIGKSDEYGTVPLRGVIDEVRIWDYVLEHNHMNASGGSGTPSENFPSSIEEYLVGRM